MKLMEFLIFIFLILLALCPKQEILIKITSLMLIVCGVAAIFYKIYIFLKRGNKFR